MNNFTEDPQVDVMESTTQEQDEAKEKSPYYMIQSVDRSLQILRCFINEGRPLGVSEVARTLKLNKSAVHRFMLTLQAHGYVNQQRDSDKYVIGPTAFELGSVYTNSTALSVEGRRILTELVKATGFLSHLAILDKKSILYLVNVEPDTHHSYLFGAAGQRGEIYISALGKCLTAWLPEDQIRDILTDCTFERRTANTIVSIEGFLEEARKVREAGYAVDNEENFQGWFCISAPVRNNHGEVIAAISINSYGIPPEKFGELIVTIKNSAAQLSRRMGGY